MLLARRESDIEVADVALYADWCSAVGIQLWPADSATLHRFAIEVPAAQKTTARRLRAIRRAQLGSQGVDPMPPPTPAGLGIEPDRLHLLMNSCPVWGWPQGVQGRRDAFVLALYGAVRLGRNEIRLLRSDGVDTSLAGSLTVLGRTIPYSPDPGRCAVCAVTRWLRVLELAHRGGWRALRNAFAARWLEFADEQQAHDCARPLRDVWRNVACLVPPLEWLGSNLQQGTNLSARSLSLVVGRAGERADRRTAAAAVPAPVMNTPRDLDRRPFSRAEQARSLAEIDALLDVIEDYVDPILLRTNALLRGNHR